MKSLFGPGPRPTAGVASDEFPLLITVSIFALAFLIPAWPWLSGAVTVPWDAKSTFYPPMRFLARALANGESPFWTPNIFAGWPQISDPQALIFSPLHFLLALLSAAPGFRAVDGVSFAYLFAGGLGIILYFRDRGWHSAGALVAALAFAFGGAASARLQHTGQIISLAYLPLTIWMLSRALERSSWRAGIVAGVLGGLIASQRDQVALLGLYVLVGFVVWYWFSGERPLARMRASLVPLIVGSIAGLLILALPVIMTELLAQRSNRPEIGYIDAGRGSLHPIHLLSLVFADLFGAMSPDVEFWGPPGWAWNERFGMADSYLAQNMVLIYSGAIPIVALLSFGLVRGLAWAREIRFFTIATALTALFSFGWYTPAFHLMYDVLPGVAFFRRPADATFVFPALMAIMTGYFVHRWLSGTVPVAARWQRVAEVAIPFALVGAAILVASMVVGVRPAVIPIVTGAAFAAGAVAVLVLGRRLEARSRLAVALLLTAFTAADFAWNNAPHISTGMKPELFEALRPNTRDETVLLLKQQLAAAASSDRRDRVELIGVGYHWPNIGLVQDFDHVLGHNPLRLKWFFEVTRAGDTVAGPDQRGFSPLYPSYRSTFADLFGVRLIATGVPVEEIDKSLKPGDLNFIGRTKDAYVYENPRALPRVMLVAEWRVADFDALIRNGWPSGVDPRRTVLLKRARTGLPTATAASAPSGTAHLVRYANTEIVVAADAPAGRLLVLNDVWHPWWRATVDGIPAEILKANVLFRAVIVPAGKHVVRFTFHPFAGAWGEIVGQRHKTL